MSFSGCLPYLHKRFQEWRRVSKRRPIVRIFGPASLHQLEQLGFGTLLLSRVSNVCERGARGTRTHLKRTAVGNGGRSPCDPTSIAIWNPIMLPNGTVRVTSSHSCDLPISLHDNDTIPTILALGLARLDTHHDSKAVDIGFLRVL